MSDGKDRTACFLAPLTNTPCDGVPVKVHIIPKQLIKREVGMHQMWDDRVWVWACGGPTGIGGHHGELDFSRRLRVPREALPEAVEEFAAEFGLTWWLEREYGT